MKCDKCKSEMKSKIVRTKVNIATNMRTFSIFADMKIFYCDCGNIFAMFSGRYDGELTIDLRSQDEPKS